MLNYLCPYTGWKFNSLKPHQVFRDVLCSPVCALPLFPNSLSVLQFSTSVIFSAFFSTDAVGLLFSIMPSHTHFWRFPSPKNILSLSTATGSSFISLGRLPQHFIPLKPPFLATPTTILQPSLERVTSLSLLPELSLNIERLWNNEQSRRATGLPTVLYLLCSSFPSNCCCNCLQHSSL